MNDHRHKKKIVIRIIGLMSAKTERTIINVEESLSGYRKFCDVEWISDPLEIARLGPIQMPSVYINGKVRAAGWIPSVHEIRTWIEEVLQEVAETSPLLLGEG
jgi:hypothetical protein